ncbi:MucR family transcriptional regulator [Methylobacterium sp. Leaf117]|uniref:MucR family transcriptional regulator n=1 Tax=Methylobacterium sp. Leaf117 TaxID=1736260 RepID=UPI0006FA9A57|nr:MucR family transcriptional regulator [Methylobacterium sp. Leaf117]KQP89825.1 MucR family transcriptional regulator [Methylobacterium sp. Leaf117]
MLDTPEENALQETAVDYVDITADIVSAYIANNSVRPAELSELIASVHQTLKGLGGPATPAADQIEKPTPAEIKKSITPDALISFEDGKPYKTLRRHLTMRGLTPEAYRAKYGLSRDYPMTSATYSAHRSELARSLGLGQQRRGWSKAAEPDGTVSEASAEPKKKKAGRAAKAS